MLRAAAALAVVLYHTGYMVAPGVHTDFQGVAVFFVISGFIIPRVGYGSSRDFIIHRVIRIVPIYWIATIADLGWFTAPGKARIALTAVFTMAAFAPEKMTEGLLKRSAKTLWTVRILGILLFIYIADFFVRGLKGLPHSTLILMLKSFAFIPARDINGDIHPYLGVGWTLNMEMYFYALFALALAINKRLAPALTAVVLIVLPFLHQIGIWNGIYAEFYSHEYIRDFVYGMGLYYAYTAIEGIPDSARRSRKVSVIVGLAAAAILVFYVGSMIRPQVFSLPYGPMLLVAAALACHLAGIKIGSPLVLILGGASYAIYLFHIFFLETVRPLLRIDTTSGMLTVLFVCSAAAVSVHRYGETPLLSLLRRRFSHARGNSKAL